MKSMLMFTDTDMKTRYGHVILTHSLSLFISDVTLGTSRNIYSALSVMTVLFVLHPATYI